MTTLFVSHPSALDHIVPDGHPERPARIRAVEGGPLTSATLDITWPIAADEAGLEVRLEELFGEADRAIDDGHGVLILSDRAVSRDRAAIPSLLALSAIHHHLVRSGSRTRAVRAATGASAGAANWCGASDSA